MNWEAIGAVGELLGALVVIVTLLYLAQQVSQSVKVSKTAAAREIQQKYADLYTLIVTDTEMRSLVTKLRNVDYEVESEDEKEEKKIKQEEEDEQINYEKEYLEMQKLVTYLYQDGNYRRILFLLR